MPQIYKIMICFRYNLSLKQSLTVGEFDFGKYLQHGDCLYIHLVQVHTHKQFQCKGKYLLFYINCWTRYRRHITMYRYSQRL